MAVNAKVASAYVDLVARTEAFEKSLDDAKGAVGRFKSTLHSEMKEARGSIALLGEEVGIHLPRHLQTFLASLPGVAPALSAAFSSVAVLALAGIVVETGKKVYEFFEKQEQAAKKNSEAWSEAAKDIAGLNSTLELSNSKIADTIAKLEKKPGENGIRTALLEASEQADKLGEKLDKDLDKLTNVHTSSALGSIFGAEWGDEGVNQAAQAGAHRLEQLIGEYNDVLQRAADRGDKDNYNQVRQDELARIAADPTINKSIETISEYLRVNQDLAGTKNVNFDQASRAYSILSGAVQALNQQQTQELGNQQVKALEAAPKGDHAFTVDTLALDMQDAIARESFRRGMEQSLLLWGPGNGPPLGWTGDQGPANRDIFGDLRPKVELAASTFDKVHDAALDLAEQFTNLGATISHALTRTINEFNDTVMRAMTGDHGGSFRQLAQHGAENLGRVGLQYAEGTLMKALLGDRHTKPDGSKANPIYTRDADKPSAGTSGLAGAAGRGLLGILNDSDWFGRLFGGRIFGAGGIFGGGHALGGDVAAGVPIDVGELGPERFTPMVPGRITSAGAMGRGPSIGYIDARGTDPALVRAHVEAGMRIAHARSVHDATHLVADRQMRRPQ